MREHLIRNLLKFTSRRIASLGASLEQSSCSQRLALYLLQSQGSCTRAHARLNGLLGVSRTRFISVEHGQILIYMARGVSV